LYIPSISDAFFDNYWRYFACPIDFALSTLYNKIIHIKAYIEEVHRRRGGLVQVTNRRNGILSNRCQYLIGE